jgi:hypothetical protein
MKKKHSKAKCLHITAGNCAILEYLGGSKSETVNNALEFYFRKKLRLSKEEIDKAYGQYMQRHYQLSLFDEKQNSGDDDDALGLCIS